MLKYVPKWKVIDRETFIQETTSGEIEELEEEADGLIIKRMVDKREKQRIFVARLILENYTRQKKKTQAK